MKNYEGYALITGGSSGIGLEFAKQLAEQGYNLVLVARNKEKLAAEANGLKKKYSVEVVTISQDLSKLEAADIIFETLKKKKIHVGLLVNNAGFGIMGHFHELSREKALNMVNVMCVNSMDLSLKFLPPMLKKGIGGIIFLSSLAGTVPGPYYVVYSSAKAFELQMAISLHAEYDRNGIDVLAVCPGAVETEFFGVDKFPRPLDSVHLLASDEVARQSLQALGKVIVLGMPNDLMAKIGLKLNNLMTYKASETITKKIIKDMWGVQ
jgi:uncharacterized protein